MNKFENFDSVRTQAHFSGTVAVADAVTRDVDTRSRRMSNNCFY